MVPLVLIGNAGSYNIGQCDDINQLNAICTKYSIWLHLEGVYLSTLILYSVPTEIQPVASGDSITLNLSTWIGVPSLSYIVRILFIFLFCNWKKIYLWCSFKFSNRPYIKTCHDLQLTFSRLTGFYQHFKNACPTGVYYRQWDTMVFSIK